MPDFGLSIIFTNKQITFFFFNNQFLILFLRKMDIYHCKKTLDIQARQAYNINLTQPQDMCIREKQNFLETDFVHF